MPDNDNEQTTPPPPPPPPPDRVTITSIAMQVRSGIHDREIKVPPTAPDKKE